MSRCYNEYKMRLFYDITQYITELLDNNNIRYDVVTSDDPSANIIFKIENNTIETSFNNDMVFLFLKSNRSELRLDNIEFNVFSKKDIRYYIRAHVKGIE